MDKTLVIYNRYACKGKFKYSIQDVEKGLKAEEIIADMVLTEYPEHAIDLVEKSVKEGYRQVIIVGGDGTINEAVNGLIQAQKKGYGKATLGVIQNGRGNDFAFGMKIPNELKEAISLIKKAQPIPMDVGYVKTNEKSRYFCNGAGIGFDSAINYRATMSHLTGFPSYFFGLLGSLIKDFKQYDAKISWADGETEMMILLLTTMNGTREGGGFLLAPDYDFQDGNLNAVLIGNGKPLHQLLPLIPRFFTGNLDHPDILRIKTPWLKAEFSTTGLYGQADGEIICSAGTEFYAEICPEKIDIISGLPFRK